MMNGVSNEEFSPGLNAVGSTCGIRGCNGVSGKGAAARWYHEGITTVAVGGPSRTAKCTQGEQEQRLQVVPPHICTVGRGSRSSSTRS